VSISPQGRKTGVALTRNRNKKASARRAGHTKRAAVSIDKLYKRASFLLASCTIKLVRKDVEAAMDYLAANDEFMRLMESRAESLLTRPSTGPEDSPFEDLMVDTMTALQDRLAKNPLPA
jgi:hypothetical protein